MKPHFLPSAAAGELRRRAERRLGEQPAGKTPIKAKASAPRMLQELQIHQIELELQNEELRQAKAEVDAGLEKYTDLFDFAPVGYFSLDEQGEILEVNLTGSALLGVERFRLTGRRFQLFVSPASRPAFSALLERAFAKRERQSGEVSLMKGGQAAFCADVQAAPALTFNGAQKWCRVAVIDVTARKQAEHAQHRVDILAATNRRLVNEIVRRRRVEQALRLSQRHAEDLLEEGRRLREKLRSISRQALLVQEGQRREISRQLHDQISQLLIGIDVHLAVVTKAAALDPRSIRRAIATLRRLVEKSVRVVHRFARELRPTMLDDLGLVPALRSYIDHLPARPGRRIQFTAMDGVESLDGERRTVLYRVAQEALANVIKHARAHLVKVTILNTRSGVSLEIADDGRAFAVDLLASGKWNGRLGLVGMRERVEMVGGRFEVVSAPGQGTTVRAEIPFRQRGRRGHGQASRLRMRPRQAPSGENLRHPIRS